MNSSRLYGQYKKAPLLGNTESLVGEAPLARRLSCFTLGALIIVKMDVAFNHLVVFREGSRFVPIHSLCFENGEKVLRFQPQTHPPVATGTDTTLLLSQDAFCKAASFSGLPKHRPKAE